MAEALWLVQKADIGGTNQRTVNGITAVLINADSAQTEAQVKAAAVGRLVAAGHKVRSNYFSSAAMVSDLTTGPLQDNLDCYFFGRLATATKIEAA